MSALIEKLVRKVSSVLIVISIFYFSVVSCFAGNLSKCDEPLKDNSTDAKLYYDLGLSCSAQGDFQKAIYNLEKAKGVYLQQGNYQKVSEIDNALRVPKAFEEINRKIDNLSEKVDNLKSLETNSSSRIDAVISTLKGKGITVKEDIQ